MKLKHEFKNAWEVERENNKLDEIMSYSKEYMNFLDSGKTERTSAREIVKIAKTNGYISIEEVIKKGNVVSGDKIYAVNKDKAVVLFNKTIYCFLTLMYFYTFVKIHLNYHLL